MRMTRSQVALAVFTVALLMFASCAPTPAAPPPATAPAASAPAPRAAPTAAPMPVAPAAATAAPQLLKPTGELTVDVEAIENENMDPIYVSAPSQIYLSLLYDPLVGVNDDGKLDPDWGLSKKVEHSGDFKTWTFSLRQGVKFHNDTELTARDVKFSIDRVLNTKGAFSTGTPKLREMISEVVEQDPYTVVVKLKTPYTFLDWQLSRQISSEGFIVPKDDMEKRGEQAFASQPVGSGPYRFSRHISGSLIEFEAVDRHWSHGVPRFKKIIFRIVPEPVARVAAIKTGEADIAALPKEQAKALSASGITIKVKPHYFNLGLGFHEMWREDNPLHDVNIRQALTLAINRQELMKTLFAGYAEEIAIPYPWASVSAYMPALKPWPYDPARAKALLAQAGYPQKYKSPELILYAFTRPGLAEGPAMMEAIGGYWKAVGVQTKIVPTDYGTHRKKWGELSLGNGVGWYLGVSTIWPASFLPTLYKTGGVIPFLKNDPEMDRLIDEVNSAVTPQDQERLVRQVVTKFWDEQLSGALFEVGLPLAVSNKVGSWTPGVSAWDWDLLSLVRRP